MCRAQFLPYQTHIDVSQTARLFRPIEHIAAFSVDASAIFSLDLLFRFPYQHLKFFCLLLRLLIPILIFCFLLPPTLHLASIFFPSESFLAFLNIKSNSSISSNSPSTLERSCSLLSVLLKAAWSHFYLFRSHSWQAFVSFNGSQWLCQQLRQTSCKHFPIFPHVRL